MGRKMEPGRRRLIPAPGLGTAVYQLMTQRRRADGGAWDANDLAEAAETTAKTIREVIKGRGPRRDLLFKLADIFSVDAEALLRGDIRPREGNRLAETAIPYGELINPPAEGGLDATYGIITRNIARLSSANKAIPHTIALEWVAALYDAGRRELEAAMSAPTKGKAARPHIAPGHRP